MKTIHCCLVVTRTRGVDDWGYCARQNANLDTFFLHVFRLSGKWKGPRKPFFFFPEKKTHYTTPAIHRSPMIGGQLLERSVKKGRPGDVIAVLARVGKDGSRIDPTTDLNEALISAVSCAHVEVVQVLLAWVGVDGKQVDPTAENNYAIRWAVWNGHVQVVRLFIGMGGRGREAGGPHNRQQLCAVAGSVEWPCRSCPGIIGLGRCGREAGGPDGKPQLCGAVGSVKGPRRSFAAIPGLGGCGREAGGPHCRKQLCH